MLEELCISENSHEDDARTEQKTRIGAFDALCNKRDCDAAKRYWSPSYIQHSAHIEPGRGGLFNLVRSLPPTLKYEHDLIVAEGDYVISHGRFSGRGSPVNWIAADIVRIENGLLQEHSDVLQDEATEEQSKSKAPMFGTSFPCFKRNEPVRTRNGDSENALVLI